MERNRLSLSPTEHLNNRDKWDRIDVSKDFELPHNAHLRLSICFTELSQIQDKCGKTVVLGMDNCSDTPHGEIKVPLYLVRAL